MGNDDCSRHGKDLQVDGIAARASDCKDEGVTLVEFSPTTEIQPVLEQLAAQMAAGA